MPVLIKLVLPLSNFDNLRLMNVKSKQELPFLRGDGESFELVRRIDWGKTTLGNTRTWSLALKSSLNIVLHSSIPMLLFWGEEYLCFYNDQLCNAMKAEGRHPDAFGKPGAYIWPDNWPAIQPIFENVFFDGLKTGQEHMLPLFKPGNSSVQHYTLSPVFNESSNPVGLFAIGVQQSLPAGSSVSNERFQNFVRQATVGMIVLTGPEMKVEVVNDMYGRLINRTPQELYGRNLFDIIPEAEAHFRPILDSVRITGESLNLYDHPYFVYESGKRKDGFLNLVYQPYRDINGSICGVMVLCHDVTEQVLVRRKIEEAEVKARLAIESAGLGTYEVDLVTDEMTTSTQFNAIWGFEQNVQRSEFAKRIHEDDLPEREKAHAEAIHTGKLLYEARIVWPDNSLRWVKVNGHVSYDANGKPKTLIGVIQDITREKNFIDEMNRTVLDSTKESMTLNEELTATNEELSEANDRLVTANRELEQFAYVASHDLQEPLRKIQIFASLLTERFSTVLDDGANAYVQKISASALRMSNLMKDILEYARLSSNKPVFQNVDLNVVLQNVFTDFELLIAQKKVIVKNDNLPVVEAIPIQINQLFYNFIGNSIKFLRKGVEPLISISCSIANADDRKIHRLKDNKQYYKIAVHDNGIGFSQQYADQIFSIFNQLNDKGIYGGYGIGLSLCRKIIETHKGIIFAQGRENEGATFTVILPAKQ